uniref:Uncharacterized protein n=1 Tax=Erpetoichthys calabaricus TaxID=27687 RepID=A0A8C4TP16_ERPCA
ISFSQWVSAEDLELKWQKDGLSTSVLLYKNRKVVTEEQQEDYRERVHLYTDLRKGDLSLVIEDVRISDEGKYTCSVKATPGYVSWSPGEVGLVVITPKVMLLFVWWLLFYSRGNRNCISSGASLFFFPHKTTQAFITHVTLDPDTAHPHLVVSADGRRVQNLFKDQRVPDTPLRFDTWHFVLGRESFTSGQQYWEVDVKERADWYLGVVSESAQRKGRVSLKPQSGYWIVRLNSGELTALTDPETTLRLRAISQMVGVHLDCDDGRLSFYSVEDHWHIYTFNGGVTGKLYPLFEPGSEGEELEILATIWQDKGKEILLCLIVSVLLSLLYLTDI